MVKVYSRDVSDYKAGLIEENISRLGLNNIEVQVKDALVMDESMREGRCCYSRPSMLRTRCYGKKA